jgi:hypothetical protein
MNKLWRLSIFLVASVLLGSCQPSSQQDAGRVVAKIGSMTITDLECKALLSDVPQSVRDVQFVNPQERQNFIQRLIRQRLFAHLALEAGMDKDAYYVGKMQNAKYAALSSMYIRKLDEDFKQKNPLNTNATPEERMAAQTKYMEGVVEQAKNGMAIEIDQTALDSVFAPATKEGL